MGKIVKLTRKYANAKYNCTNYTKFLTIKLRVFKFYNIDSLILAFPINRIINLKNLWKTILQCHQKL